MNLHLNWDKVKLVCKNLFMIFLMVVLSYVIQVFFAPAKSISNITKMIVFFLTFFLGLFMGIYCVKKIFPDESIIFAISGSFFHYFLLAVIVAYSFENFCLIYNLFH